MATAIRVATAVAASSASKNIVSSTCRSGSSTTGSGTSRIRRRIGTSVNYTSVSSSSLVRNVRCQPPVPAFVARGTCTDDYCSNSNYYFYSTFYDTEQVDSHRFYTTTATVRCAAVHTDDDYDSFVSTSQPQLALAYAYEYDYDDEDNYNTKGGRNENHRNSNIDNNNSYRVVTAASSSTAYPPPSSSGLYPSTSTTPASISHNTNVFGRQQRRRNSGGGPGGGGGGGGGRHQCPKVCTMTLSLGM
jgi:hypothetical protein